MTDLEKIIDLLDLESLMRMREQALKDESIQLYTKEIGKILGYPIVIQVLIDERKVKYAN